MMVGSRVRGTAAVFAVAGVAASANTLHEPARANPDWHIMVRPCQSPVAFADAVLQLVFNPYLEPFTAADLQTANQVMVDVAANGATAQATVKMIGSGPCRIALLLSQVVRPGQRRKPAHQLYNEEIATALRTTELLTYRGIEDASLQVGFDYASRHAHPDYAGRDLYPNQRLALSLAGCDTAEPSNEVRAAARKTVNRFRDKTIAAVADAVVNPALWDPRYAHTTPDSDGWEEILHWCTSVFTTSAAAKPWQALKVTPIVATDFVVNGFTPETAAPWLTLFAGDARTASVWATAGVTPNIGAAWAALAGQHPAWGPSAPVNPARNHQWGTLPEMVRLHRAGIQPGEYHLFEQLTPAQIDTWFETCGPVRACAYLQAGYTIEEAAGLDANPAARPDLDTLHVAGALND